MNLYSRMELSLGGMYHYAICAVQLQLVRRDSYLSTTQGVKKLKKLALPFFWNSKPETFKRESLLNTLADGGLNIINIRTKSIYQTTSAINRACKWVTIHCVTPRDWSLLGTKRD